MPSTRLTVRNHRSIIVAVAIMTLAGCSTPDATASESPVDIGEVLVATDGDDETATTEVLSPVTQVSATPVTEVARMFQAGEVHSVRLIGDSITAGDQCDGYAEAVGTLGPVIYSGSEGTYYETAQSVACWANDFRAYATEHGVTDFTNAGICGAKMWWLAREPEAWLGGGADVIVVMLGTNDAVYSPPEQYAQDAEVALAAASRSCRQLVVLSPPANERIDATNRYGADVLDRVLTDVCERNGYLHVSLTDVLEVYSDDLSADRCHPTSSGSHKLWEALRTALGL